MGLSKYSYTYLNWGYEWFTTIVTSFITLVTKSHGPPSRQRLWGLLSVFRGLELRVYRGSITQRAQYPLIKE